MTRNPNVPYGSDYQSLMNYRLQLARKESGLLDRSRIASMMDLQDNTLYKHSAGLLPTSADFARNLIAAIAQVYPNEMEFMSFFIPEGYHVVRDEDVKTGSQEAKLTDLSIIVGKVQEQTSAAYKDKKITRAEHREICRLACELKRKATEIEEKVKGDIE
jgi:hypothetical protein